MKLHGGEWLTSRSDRFSSGKGPPAVVEYETCWAPQPSGRFKEGIDLVLEIQSQFLRRPAREILSIANELSPPHSKKQNAISGDSDSYFNNIHHTDRVKNVDWRSSTTRS